MVVLSLVGIILLCLTHFFVNRLRLSRIPRSKWLSFGGGVSVAYVFIHLLPEINAWQLTVEEKGFLDLKFLEHHIYLFALIGLTSFYGLERAAKTSHESNKEGERGEKQERKGVFWIHIGSFSVYNVIIGYVLLARFEQDVSRLILYVIAMGFHFMVNDFGLYEHYKLRYEKEGRWILTLSLMLGWILALIFRETHISIGFVFAFIAGGIIMNILKEELPDERKSNYGFFLIGVTLYTLILLSSSQ